MSARITKSEASPYANLSKYWLSWEGDIPFTEIKSYEGDNVSFVLNISNPMFSTIFNKLTTMKNNDEYEIPFVFGGIIYRMKLILDLLPYAMNGSGQREASVHLNIAKERVNFSSGYFISGHIQANQAEMRSFDTYIKKAEEDKVCLELLIIEMFKNVAMNLI